MGAKERRGDRRVVFAVDHRPKSRSCWYGKKPLRRWMKVSEFQSALRDARREAFGQAIARLQQGSSAAAATLLRIMLDKDTPTSCQLRAADSVMDHAAKAIELEDIEARLTLLEEAAGETGKRR